MGISPGATDAGASCAVMLELASVLVSREQKLQYDVLLLFVDSEENGLVGSSNWVFGNNDSLDASFHVEPHPWSLLPALVINLEGSGIANGKEVLARANSKEVTKFYASYARSPRAVSLTEFLFRTIDAGATDTDIYFLAGLHCMDLIFIQDRWAYHSPSDNVDNVRPDALKHLGDNVLSLISGITNDQSFPLDRFSDKELYDMKASQRTQDSKTVYFSILESSTIYQTRANAKAMYISISLLFGCCIYFLTPPRAYFPRGKIFTISIHFFSALMNFITGIIFSVAVFAVFGSWKKPIELEDGQNYYYGHGAPYFVWANKEAARSVLSFFSVSCSTYFFYSIVRSGWKKSLLCCWKESKKDNENVNIERENDVENHAEQVVVENSTTDEMSTNSELVRIGMSTHIGIFYFYDILLLIFGIFLPDATIFVLFQAVFFWIGSLLDAIFHGFVWNDAEEIPTDEATFRNELKGWALRSFVVVIPSLLVIPDGFMALLLYIGYYVDEFGLWYGTTIVEAFCFGLIIPLIIPTIILIPSEYAKVLGFLLLFALCISGIVCIAI